MGVCFGITEVLRRVAPRVLVGDHPQKLNKVAAIIQIFYELAAAAGAFISFPLITILGPAYSLFVLPVGFSVSSLFYWRAQFPYAIYGKLPNPEIQNSKKTRVVQKTQNFVLLYIRSVVFGAKLLFSERHYIWIVPAYVVPLCLHFYIKGTLLPLYANAVLKNGTLNGILLGSNTLGSLVGGLLLLVFLSKVRSPLPWVRLGAVMLLMLWVFPYLTVDTPGGMVGAFVPFLVVIGAGYASGDVALTAYLQATIPTLKVPVPLGLSALSSVVAFLYSCYLLLFTILNIGMGFLFNSYANPRDAMVWMAGVVGVIFAVGVFAATFIPENSCSVNPEESVRMETVEEEEEFAITF